MKTTFRCGNRVIKQVPTSPALMANGVLDPAKRDKAKIRAIKPKTLTNGLETMKIVGPSDEFMQRSKKEKTRKKTEQTHSGENEKSHGTKNARTKKTELVPLC